MLFEQDWIRTNGYPAKYHVAGGPLLGRGVIEVSYLALQVHIKRHERDNPK